MDKMDCFIADDDDIIWENGRSAEHFWGEIMPAFDVVNGLKTCHLTREISATRNNLPLLAEEYVFSDRPPVISNTEI